MPQAAAIYCRISADKGGEGLGVERQRELCAQLAERLGWPIAETYADNDVSAYNGARREQYERMLEDLKAGTRDAVIVVDQDRLVRRTRELEEFIDLADAHGVALANVSGDLDLATADGRLRAKIMGVVAQHESEKKAERMRREREQYARAGKPALGGTRPFGFAEDRVTHDPAEAALIREAARRVLAGESMHSICSDWNDRGIETAGRADGWTTASMSSMLRNPRLAGLRTYKGEVVAEGIWDPIIDRATHEELVAKLSRSRRPRRRGRPASKLLVALARCGKCGGPLWAGHRAGSDSGGPRYACVAGPGRGGCGGITVSADQLDRVIRDAVIEVLAGDNLAEARLRLAEDDDAETRAAEDLTDAEARREELAADYAEGTITRREWMAARERLEERITAARRTLDRNGRATVLADVPSDPDELRETWDAQIEAGELEWCRAVIRAVLDRIIVNPAPRPGRFAPERVELVWRV